MITRQDTGPLTAADFAGDWRLARVLTDRLGAMSGTFTGTARFTADGSDALAYHESGQLTLRAGAVLQAERDYRWVWTATNVTVFFADGAPFHDFRPTGMGTGTPHLCGADLYTVTYDFRAWPRWQAVWEVRGPKKNYRSVSDYTPA